MYVLLKLVLKVSFPDICHHPVLIAFSKTEDSRSRNKGTKQHRKLLHVHTSSSLASYTLHREEESGHAATIEFSPRQKLAVTNEICTVCSLHPLSWSSNYVSCLADVSMLLSNGAV